MWGGGQKIPNLCSHGLWMTHLYISKQPSLKVVQNKSLKRRICNNFCQNTPCFTLVTFVAQRDLNFFHFELNSPEISCTKIFETPCASLKLGATFLGVNYWTRQGQLFLEAFLVINKKINIILFSPVCENHFLLLLKSISSIADNKRALYFAVNIVLSEILLKR